MSSNLHRNSTEANKHTPKGFDLADNNSTLLRDERGQSRYIDNLVNERVENLVDGFNAPPTTTSGHLYVLIDEGSGTVNTDWNGANYNDIVRIQDGVWVNITPVNGYLVFNKTDEKYYKFGSAGWQKLINIVEDTTPQLGGDLDLNNNDINGTGNVDITGNVIADIVQLRGGTGTQGEMSWSTDEETVKLIMDGTTLYMGQDTFVHVRNNTASIITKGTAVYATGTLGASGRITVAPMIANGTIAGRLFIGLAAEDIAIGADGQVCSYGKIRGINTTAYNDGDVLWISPTVAGQLTATEPTAPNLKIATAFVIHDATNGTLMVRAEQGNDLHSDQRVQVSGLTNNDVLTWNNANQRWENAQPVLPNWGSIGGTLSAQTDLQTALDLKLNIADSYGGKRYTLIKPNGTKEFYDTLVQVTSNWADGDTLHQFANETLAITNATTISGYICWRELPAINWNGNGHSILFNVTGTSAFAVNANKNINFFDLRLTYNCADNSSSNGLIKSPTTSFLNGNGSTTLAQNVTVSNANHLNAFGLIGNFDNFNITSLHDKTWQVPGFCNGTFTNCNIRNVYTNRAATFIGCNFNEFVANLFSATTIIFDNCTLVNSIDALLTSNQGTVTITNCNMRFNVNSGIIMNATVVMNNSTINNVGNGLMFAAYNGSNNIVKTTGSGGFLNTASVVIDYGSIFESTGGWNFRFTGSGSFFERTKFINNGTGGSLNTDVSGTGLKASFVDCIFFCAGTNNVGAVSDTYSFVGCTFNRTNFAFMYAGTQQQLLDNDPKRLTNVIDSRGNKGHGCRSPYPPMTTTERNSLTGVSKGFTIENTTTNFLQVYNGSTWKDLLDLT